MNEEINKELKKYYYDAESPGNFGNLTRLKESLNKNEKKYLTMILRYFYKARERIMLFYLGLEIFLGVQWFKLNLMI